MVKTRNRSHSPEKRAATRSESNCPAAVSEEGSGQRGRGITRLNSAPGNLGAEDQKESSSSVSSLDTSVDSASVATPLFSHAVPRQVSASAASLPARLTSKKSSTKKNPPKTPTSNTKSAAARASSSAKKQPKTPGSASSVRSKNPARTNKAGIPVEPDQRVIAQETENKGGIKIVFAQSESNPLHNLCEERSANPDKGGVEIWGVSGSERRKKIKAKTRQWRELGDTDWKELCGSIRVVTADILAARSKLFGHSDTSTLERVTKPAPQPALQPAPQPTLQPAPQRVNSIMSSTNEAASGTPRSKFSRDLSILFCL